MNPVLATCLTLVAAQVPLPPEVTPLPPLPPAPTAESLRLPTPGLPARRLTVDEAIALALRTNPSIQQSQARVEQAAGGARSAHGRALPGLSLSYSFQSDPLAGFATGRGVGGIIPSAPVGGLSTQGTPPPGPLPEFDFGQFITRHTFTASLSQLLFDFGRARALTIEARRRLDAARAAFDATAASVANRVRQNYYALLQAEGLVNVQMASLEARRVSLAAAQARFEEGAAPFGDVARATASVAQAQSSLAQALATAERSRVALNEVIGIEPHAPTDVVMTSEPEPPLPPLDRVVDEAYRRRPEVRQGLESLRAESAGLRAARRGDLPSVSAGLVYSFRGRDVPGRPAGPGFTLSVSWTPFDAGITRGQVEQSRGRVQEAEGSLREVRLSIGAEVARAYQDVRAAEQTVASARVAVASARESLRIARERYLADVATLVEVTDAESALVAAETDRVNADHDLSRARAALAYALGPAPEPSAPSRPDPSRPGR